MDAKQLLHETLRDRVAPALREMGFRGSGRRFRLPSPRGDYALVGILGWKYNSPEVAWFTVDVAFYRAEEWEAYRAGTPFGKVPSPHNEYMRMRTNSPNLGWHERIGYLLPDPHDHWWAIRDVDRAQVVAEHVTAVVRDHALPHLRARLEGDPPPPIRDLDEADDDVLCPWPDCDPYGDLDDPTIKVTIQRVERPAAPD